MQENKLNKVITAINNWNTQYGMVEITEVSNSYLIEFATGGWSENENIDTAGNLYDIFSVSDSGGYYLIELYKNGLNKEQIDKINNLGISIKKKKKFMYKWER